MLRVTEVAIRPVARLTLRISFSFPCEASASPCADSSASTDEERSHEEEGAFQLSMCWASLDEPPHDIVAIEKIGQEGSPNNQCAEQHTMTVFKLGSHRCIHCWEPSTITD